MPKRSMELRRAGPAGSPDPANVSRASAAATAATRIGERVMNSLPWETRDGRAHARTPDHALDRRPRGGTGVILTGATIVPALGPADSIPRHRDEATFFHF